MLVMTALAFNPEGLGAWADMLSAWFTHLNPVVNGQPWYYILLALALYEPFLLVFGIVGGGTLLLRGQQISGSERDLRLFVWLVVGFILLSLLAGGRGVGDVALACVSLAI